MKLKRIFMTGVLASSMLALAACGDDAEGKKTEETPVEEGKETEKAKDTEGQGGQSGEGQEGQGEGETETEKGLTLSGALTAFNDFSFEDYINQLIESYKGDNSYLTINGDWKEYSYDGQDKLENTHNRSAQYIYTLDDIAKVYGIETGDNNTEGRFEAIKDGIVQTFKFVDKSYSYKSYEMFEDLDEGMGATIAALIQKFIFGGNPIENAEPFAKIVDQYKDMIVPYLINNVKEVDGKEVIDVQSMIADAKSLVTEKTGVSDPFKAILAVIEPFIASEDPTVEGANKYGFIKLEIRSLSSSGLSFDLSLDQTLLANVLTEAKNNNMTLAGLLEDAYGLDENTIADYISGKKFPAISYVAGFINKVINTAINNQSEDDENNSQSSTQSKPVAHFDIQSMLLGSLNRKITDGSLAAANMLDFDFTIDLDGNFATKVALPIEMYDKDEDEFTTMPLAAYVSQNNGELFAIVGGNNPTVSSADEDTLNVYKNLYGVNDALLNPFIGQIPQPMGYVTYLVDATDSTKSVLNVNAFDMPYKAEITNGDTFNIVITGPAFDEKGDPVVENNELKCEEIATISYTEADGLSLNAYYMDYSLVIEDNSITFVKPYISSSATIGNAQIAIRQYEETVVNYNTEDSLIDVTVKQYANRPAEGVTQDPISTRYFGIKEVENGFEIKQELENEYEYGLDVLTITKKDSEDNSVYSFAYTTTFDDASEKKIENQEIRLSFDENAKSLSFFKANNYCDYIIENNTKKITNSTENASKIDATLSVDEENDQLVLDLKINNYKGLEVLDGKFTLNHSTDAENEEALISEVETKIAENNTFKFNKTVAELIAENQECEASGPDGNDGCVKINQLVIDDEKKIVSYDGEIKFYSYVDYYNYYADATNVYTFDHVNIYANIQGDLGLDHYEYLGYSSRVRLFTDNNKISNIIGRQSISVNGVNYIVVYQNDTYTIYDENQNDVTATLIADDEFKTILDGCNTQYKTHIVNFNKDSIVTEIELNYNTNAKQ